MGGEEGTTAGVLDQTIHHRMSDGRAVERRGTTTELVEDAQRVFRRGVEDRGGLSQLDKERRLTSENAVAGADAGVDTIHGRHLAVIRGDFASHLGENGDETGLTKQCTLAC